MSPRVLVRIGAALVAATAFVVVYVALVRTELGQRIDDLGLEAGAVLKVWTRDTIPWHEIKGGVYVLLLVVPALVLGHALWRRRVQVVMVGAAVIAISFGVGQVLKATLPRPEMLAVITPLGFNTFPSGHTIAAASTAVAAVMVVTPRWRARAMALGALYAGGMGGFVLLTAQHRLSDVLGAFAIVAMVTAIASIALTPTAARPSEIFTSIVLSSVGLGGLVIASVAFIRLTVDVGTGGADRSEQFTGLVASIVTSLAVACLLAGVLPRALRHRKSNAALIAPVSR